MKHLEEESESLYMGNISEVTRSLWAGRSERTQRLLEQIAETNEDMASQIAEVIQQECDHLRYGVYEPRITTLTRQLDDALTVVNIQEKELLGRKGSKVRDMRTKIAELEQHCAELQAKLERKPIDDGQEHTALAEGLMLIGEQIGYKALFCDENDDLLVGNGLDAYLVFAFAETTSTERLQMANEAAGLVLQNRESRKKLAQLQP